MRASRALIGALFFARRHLVSTACIGGFAFAMLRVTLAGAGPVPQEPPEGYTLTSGRASLGWNRGTRPAPITLEVSEDAPTFATPVYRKVVAGTSFTLTTTRPGKKYYWRLVQDGRPSPTATFEASPDYADF
jgi:hypothetical protein